MFKDLEAPLEGNRLLVARIVLVSWGIVFAGAVVAFGVVLILYFSPGMPLGPEAPVPLCIALFLLLCTGVPWVPAYLQYRKARRPTALAPPPSPVP